MINEVLRLLRLIYDFKSKDLAAKLGISQSYLSEIENGKKTPSLELLEKYSRVLNIKASSLLFFSEELSAIQTKSSVKNIVQTNMVKLMQIIEKFGGLNNE